jgi:hypothetical protein
MRKQEVTKWNKKYWQERMHRPSTTHELSKNIKVKKVVPFLKTDFFSRCLSLLLQETIDTGKPEGEGPLGKA